MPSQLELRQQQPVLSAGGFPLRRLCTSPSSSAPCDGESFRVSYTFSKALNNVGEFFFSSPIDPYNIWQDYGRSDDDQRHRVGL